jgi:phage host-nuclease inhibitor protein Gam
MDEKQFERLMKALTDISREVRGLRADAHRKDAEIAESVGRAINEAASKRPRR